MTTIPYPLCDVNPKTGKPYTRHNWIIPANSPVVRRMTKNGPVEFYRIICSRCGVIDPKSPVH